MEAGANGSAGSDTSTEALANGNTGSGTTSVNEGVEAGVKFAGAAAMVRPGKSMADAASSRISDASQRPLCSAVGLAESEEASSSVGTHAEGSARAEASHGSM